MRDADAVSRVLADLADGEHAVLMKHIPDQPEVADRGGRKLNPRVGVRWTLNGVKAPDGRTVKLDSMSGPTGRITTRAALRRFLAAINGIEQLAVPEVRTSSRRQRETAEAEKVLAGAGFRI